VLQASEPVYYFCRLAWVGVQQKDVAIRIQSQAALTVLHEAEIHWFFRRKVISARWPSLRKGAGQQLGSGLAGR